MTKVSAKIQILQNPFPVDPSKDGRSLWSPDPTTIIIIYTQNGVLIIPPVKTQGHWEKKIKFQTAQKIS